MPHQFAQGMKYFSTLLVLLPAMVLVPLGVTAQPKLTGMSMYSSVTNGSPPQGDLWDTRTDFSRYNIYFFTGGLAQPVFLNGGNTDASLNPDLTLVPGTNVIYCSGDTAPSGYLGINIYFDGQSTNQITAAVPIDGSNSFAVVPAGRETFGINGPQPSSGSLSATAGGTIVTLVDYQVILPRVDLVAPFAATPNSGLDTTARLTLVVGPCTPRPARATAVLVNGFVVGATVTDGGCGYTNPPAVFIQGGGGTGAQATAVVNNGQVTAVNIAWAGCCYTNAPRILIASPPFMPRVGIRTSRVKVSQEVVLGRRYVLESSNDRLAWTPVGPAFTAMAEFVEDEFEVETVGRFFRLRESP
jgi:hypothetical protein